MSSSSGEIRQFDEDNLGQEEVDAILAQLARVAEDCGIDPEEWQMRFITAHDKRSRKKE